MERFATCCLVRSSTCSDDFQRYVCMQLDLLVLSQLPVTGVMKNMMQQSVQRQMNYDSFLRSRSTRQPWQQLHEECECEHCS